MNAKLAKEVFSRAQLARTRELAEKYCPEMLDEVITSPEMISDWVDRFIAKLPEDIRRSYT